MADMRPLKILYLCHRFPYPPNDGSRVRSFHIIRHFKESGHQVTVASMTRSADETVAGADMSKYCDRVLQVQLNELWQKVCMVANLLSLVPSSMAYFKSRQLARQIEQEIQTNRPDLIYVHCSSVGPYVMDYDIPKVMDFVDMDSAKLLAYADAKSFPLSSGYWYEGVKLRRAEKRLAQKFSVSTCITQAELDTLNDYGLEVPADWFPNGVDHEFFCPDPDSKKYDPHTICFIGRMDYYPNVECMQRFCRQILPLIKQQYPEVKMLIVGADPVPDVVALGAIDGVTVTGTVDDVRSYVRNSALMVAPLQIARGTQNKILEAMAMGVPVVCSAAAARGVNATNGQQLLIAESDEDCAAQAINLLRDHDMRKHLSQAGRAWIEQHYTWSKAMVKLDEILNQMVGKP